MADALETVFNKGNTADDTGGAYIYKGNRALDAFQEAIKTTIADAQAKKAAAAKEIAGIDAPDDAKAWSIDRGDYFGPERQKVLQMKAQLNMDMASGKIKPGTTEYFQRVSDLDKYNAGLMGDLSMSSDQQKLYDKSIDPHILANPLVDREATMLNATHYSTPMGADGKPLTGSAKIKAREKFINENGPLVVFKEPTVDLNKLIKETAGNIGNITYQDDNGVTKIITENDRARAEGSLNEAVNTLLQTDQGKLWVAKMQKDKMTPDQIEKTIKDKLWTALPKGVKTDVTLQHETEGDKKKVHIDEIASKTVNAINPVLRSEYRDADGRIIDKKAYDALSPEEQKKYSAGGDFQEAYVNNETGKTISKSDYEAMKADPAQAEAVKKYLPKTAQTSIEMRNVVEFPENIALGIESKGVLDANTGKPMEDKGQIEYEVIGVQDIPMIKDRDGNLMMMTDDVRAKYPRAPITWKKYTVAREKTGMKDQFPVYEPRYVPYTEQVREAARRKGITWGAAKQAPSNRMTGKSKSGKAIYSDDGGKTWKYS